MRAPWPKASQYHYTEHWVSTYESGLGHKQSTVVPTTTKSGSLCLNHLYKPYTCLPPGSLEFWCVPGRGCLCDNPPVKLWAWESLISFPDWHFARIVILVAGKFKCILCDSLEEALGSLCLVSLDFTHVPFLFWLSLISSHWNKSQPWVQLHAETCESSKWIFKPRGWSWDFSTYHHHDVALKKSLSSCFHP